jgi:hypothetical protein
MFRATVPKAPIDEDSHLWPDEYKVGSHPTSWKIKPLGDAEPKALAMKQRANRQLRPGVPAPDLCHDAAPDFGGIVGHSSSLQASQAPNLVLSQSNTARCSSNPARLI